jgi:glutathione synthase
MTIKIGVVMDPIGAINPKKDSTLAMLVAAQKRGWEISYMEQGDLFAKNGGIWAKQRHLSVADSSDKWYEYGDVTVAPLNRLDVILMRKEPPFDMEYIYSTYLLEMAESQGAWVLNNPSSIRDCNEKLFALQFPQCCPPHLVTRSAEQLREFQREQGDIVIKPLDGMGGSSIFRVKEGDPNFSVIIETITLNGERQVMAQQYLPAIVNGDTRILLIDGNPVAYGLARIPAKGETRGNLAAGAQGVGRPLNDRDRWICQQIEPTLQSKGLAFVGIDVIGDYLTEVNVTCPTCIKEINSAYDLDIAGDYMDYIDRHIR